MASDIKGKEVELQASAQAVFDRFSQPGNLHEFLDNIPEDKVPADKLEQLRAIRVTDDSITLPGGPAGSVKLVKDYCEAPEYISYRAADVPVDIKLILEIKPVTEQTCRVNASIKLEVPMMMKPMLSMVKPQLQQLVDGLADMLEKIPF